MSTTHEAVYGHGGIKLTAYKPSQRIGVEVTAENAVMDWAELFAFVDEIRSTRPTGTNNPHYEAAENALEDQAAGGSWLNPQETALSVANTQATLALAHEQHTANLIALLDAGYSTAKVAGVNYEDVADLIKERLGL